MDLITYLRTWFALTDQICPVENLLMVSDDHFAIQHALWSQVLLSGGYKLVETAQFRTYQNFVRFRHGYP